MGMSYTDVAEAIGISRNSLYDIIKEGSTIKHSVLIELYKNFDIDINWVLTGTRKSTRVMEDYQTYHLDLDAEFTRIPYLRSIKAGAGYGLAVEQAEKHDIAFRKYFIEHTLHSRATELIALRVGGNSMEPLLQDGDDILVDRSKIQIKEGPAYLIRIDEEIFVKYLSKMPGHRLKVWSENRAFEPFEVDQNSSAGEFEVLGQVVWWAHVSEYL